MSSGRSNVWQRFYLAQNAASPQSVDNRNLSGVQFQGGGTMAQRRVTSGDVRLSVGPNLSRAVIVDGGMTQV